MPAKTQTPEFPEFLKSWKEIANYMRCGVRTVQRYERELGLPVRRPAGMLRGSVMATRAELDAWVAARPIRETFRLPAGVAKARARANLASIEDGLAHMNQLRQQMLTLNAETRSALTLLREGVARLRAVMPPSRPSGYEPLVTLKWDNEGDEVVIDHRSNGSQRTARVGGHQDDTLMRLTSKPH